MFFPPVFLIFRVFLPRKPRAKAGRGFSASPYAPAEGQAEMFRPRRCAPALNLTETPPNGQNHRDGVVPAPNSPPPTRSIPIRVWAQQDLNLRPKDYESSALTN